MADLSFWQVAGAVVALTAGSILQTSSGFGFALLALPLLGWLGIPPPMAITMSVASMMLQGAWLLATASESVPVRENVANLAVTVMASVVGVLLLTFIWESRPELLGQLIGALVVLGVVAAYVVRPTPRPRVGAGWTAAAMAASGLFSGLSSIGGPPIALWAMAHDWSADRIRVTSWLMVLPRSPVLLAALYLSFGQLVLRALLVVLIAVPGLWLGSVLGRLVAKHITTERLRPVAMIILLLTGASALLRPLLAA